MRALVRDLWIVPVALIVALIGAHFASGTTPAKSTGPVAQIIESNEVDPISGETIRHIDQEPEEPWDGVSLVGFKIFSDIGFTAQQQEIIFTAVQEFFTENYPNMRRLSYKQNSISYDAANDDLVYCELVSDTNEVFRIKLDIQGSILRVAVAIYDENGNLLN